MRADISSSVLAGVLLLTPAATVTLIYVNPDSPNNGPNADTWRSLNIRLSAHPTPDPERK